MRTAMSERGAALPTIAIMLVVILGMAAFAVDLGWLFLSANRVQKTADAASLAGVVNLPFDFDQAQIDAAGAVSANGLSGGTLTATPIVDNKLQVDLTVSVETFFLNIFGIEAVDITRRSTAQYILPIRLGSDQSCFGTSPGEGACPIDPRFWAAISGPGTSKGQGDAYATRCTEDSGSCGSVTNGEYRSAGYYYGIQTDGSAFTVRLYDAGFYERANFQEETGDQEQDTNGGLTTSYQLFAPDTTPYDPTNNTTPVGSCSLSLAPEAGSGKNDWLTLCSVNPPAAGIYVLRVSSSGGGGTNQFAIATSSNAQVFGINDMSIMNNTTGTAVINIAEVPAIHAGKTLLLDLWDPGEADSGTMNILSPGSSIPPPCSYTVSTTRGGSGSTTSLDSCSIVTASGGALFHNQWLRIEIEIPEYTCTSCFWRVDYNLTGQANDRTTWGATVIGNPVRLVPNEP